MSTPKGAKEFFIISHNGFGISEVAGGISERSGEIPKGNFAYSVLCEVASGASGEHNRNYFRSRYAEKERATRPTEGREGERAISA